MPILGELVSEAKAKEPWEATNVAELIIQNQQPTPEPEPEKESSWWDKLKEGLTKKLPIATNLRVYYDEAGNELHREAVDTPIEQRYKDDYFKTKIISAKTPIGMVGELLEPSPEWKEKYHLPTAMSIIETKINKGEELSQEELDTVDTFMKGHMLRPFGMSWQEWSKMPPALQKTYNYAVVGTIVFGLFAPAIAGSRTFQKVQWTKEIRQIAKVVKTKTGQGMSFSNIAKDPAFIKYATKYSDRPWWKTMSAGAKGTPFSSLFKPQPEAITTPYEFAYTAPLIPEWKMLKETVEALPKFTPLTKLATEMGFAAIPDIGTSQYIEFFKKLDDKQQELALEMKELLEDSVKAVKGGTKEEAEIAEVKSEQQKLLATTKEMPDIKTYELFAAEETEATRQMDMYKQEYDKLIKAGASESVAKTEALGIAGKKYIKKTGKPATQLKWEFGAPTLKGQKELGLETPAEAVAKAGIEKIIPKSIAKKPSRELLVDLGKLSKKIKVSEKVPIELANQWDITLTELTNRNVKTKGQPIVDYYKDVTSKILRPELAGKAEIALKPTMLTPEITASHDEFVGLLTNYEKEVDPVKRLDFAEKAHHIRNKIIAEKGVDVLDKKTVLPDLTAIEYENFPPAKLVVKEGLDELKIKQNTGIAKKITETNTIPSKTQQEVYVYNHTGETIADADELQKQFLRLLKTDNLRAYNHLSRAALSNEEIIAKLDATTKEIESARIQVDAEMEALREYVTPKGETEVEEYRAFLGEVRNVGGIKYGSATRDYKDQYKNWPLSIKNRKGSDLDEVADMMGLDIEVIADKLSYPPAPAESIESEAVSIMDDNINDFPNYKLLKDAEERAETLRIELLDRNVKLPEPAPTEKVVEKIPFKPPITVEKIKPNLEFEAHMKEALAGWKKIQDVDQLEFSHKDMLTEPKTIHDITPGGPPTVPPEQLFFSDIVPPDDLPIEIEPWPAANKDLAIVMKVRRVGDAMSDFERATGVPVYSDGFREIYDNAQSKDIASQLMNATITNMYKGIKKPRRIVIGKAMEGIKGALKDLSPAEREVFKAAREFMKKAGPLFGVSEERMINWYLPHLMKAHRSGDPSKVAKEFEPFMRKVREHEDFAPRMEDPLKIMRIYISQGLKAKYFYDNKVIPNFVKHIQNQPPGFKQWAKDWLAYDILRRPTKGDMAAGRFIEKMPGMSNLLEKWDTTGVGALEQITRGLGSLMYSSALGFRIASPAKNSFQQLHNLLIWGPTYWLRGILRAFEGEEIELVNSLNILRQYGVMLERHGVDTSTSAVQKATDAALYLFMKVDSGSRRTGHGAETVVVEDADALLKAGAIDQDEFLKMTRHNLTLWADQSRILKILETEGTQAYADAVAKDLIHLAQYDYFSANFPTLFAGRMGRLLGMFTSWPIQFLEMQARFIKQGKGMGRFKYLAAYILGSLVIINLVRRLGIETGEPGYPEIKVGNSRIAIIPGGWFLTGSMPTDVAPAAQILYQGGKLVMAVTSGGWDRWTKNALNDFKRASKLLVPFGITTSDIYQMFKELKEGKYGKMDRSGRFMYISDEAEVILRGMGFTTTQEIEKTGRDTGYKFELPWIEEAGRRRRGEAPSCPYHLP